MYNDLLLYKITVYDITEEIIFNYSYKFTQDHLYTQKQAMNTHSIHQS